ncbi:DNA internalization-related competence protein ComEC/Rec2 [Shewanella sp. AC91-MNA-CIBAN-0169]|uniref:DNA internalization-related competence protein ComEC/Rec2 n=1 Tax=Shewanella sp. AC91-MNA-CIBAN-0169 TaxID=3140466 RepID=UPI0033324A9D
MLWPSLAPIWCLPILFLAMLLCLRKGPLMAGCLFAVIWLSLLFHCLYMHQYAEKSQQIEFKAQIVSLVSQNSDWISFDVRVMAKPYQDAFLETLSLNNVQRYYRLTWQKPDKIVVGQIWQFSAKVKGISSIQNQGGFNQQKYFISKHIVAKGRVKQAELLSHSGSIRQQIMETLSPLLAHFSQGDILQALIFGDKSALTSERWQQLRQTGAGHLVAISGLHLAVVFGLFYGILIGVSRYVFSWQHLAKIQLAMVFAAAFTLGYGYLSGFAIATQRALLMLFLLMIFSFIKQFSHHWDRLVYALFFVLLVDPFASLGAGLWLSFGALVIILLSVKPDSVDQRSSLGTALVNPDIEVSKFTLRDKCIQKAIQLKDKILHGLIILWSIQWRLALLLGVLQGILFGGIAPHSIWLNMLLVPWFSLVVIPLTMLSFCIWLLALCILWLLAIDIVSLQSLSVMIFQWANFSLEPFAWLLQLSDRLPLKQLVLTEQELAAGVFFVLALILLMLRGYVPSQRKWGYRVIVSVLMLPVIMNKLVTHEILLSPASSLGSTPWQLHAIDVAQGMAVVLQQGQHGVIYDTGAAYGEFSYAQRAILPFLASKGIRYIDYIVVSHDDNDHAGGLNVLVEQFPQATLIADFSASALTESSHSVQTCDGELLWRGVQLSFIPNILSANSNDNNRSCVVKLFDGQSTVLLTGDIEAPREQALLAVNADIQADILFVPHHGSRTSSTQAFIDSVNPQLAIFTAGFSNQYGFPKPDIVARYQQQGSKILQTGHVGQISINFTDEGYKVTTYRQQIAPFWYNRLFRFGESLKAE